MRATSCTSDRMSHSIPLTRVRSHRGLVGLGFAALCYTAGALGVATMRGARRPGLWLRVLRKSPLQPPGRLFGPVWSALYAVIAYSAWRIWRALASAERT